MAPLTNCSSGADRPGIARLRVVDLAGDRVLLGVEEHADRRLGSEALVSVAFSSAITNLPFRSICATRRPSIAASTWSVSRPTSSAAAGIGADCACAGPSPGLGRRPTAAASGRSPTGPGGAAGALRRTTSSLLAAASGDGAGAGSRPAAGATRGAVSRRRPRASRRSTRRSAAIVAVVRSTSSPDGRPATGGRPAAGVIADDLTAACRTSTSEMRGRRCTCVAVSPAPARAARRAGRLRRNTTPSGCRANGAPVPARQQCPCEGERSHPVAVHPLVDAGGLADPASAVAVLEGHHVVMRPVEVIGEEGHLLDAADRGGSSRPPHRSSRHLERVVAGGADDRLARPAVDLVVGVLEEREIGGEEPLDRLRRDELERAEPGDARATAGSRSGRPGCAGRARPSAARARRRPSRGA